MIQVIYMDDHSMVREGVKKIIEQPDLDMQVIGEAAGVDELMGLLKQSPPDIIIMDLAVGGVHCLAIIKELRKLYPEIPVLILTIYPEERYAVRALKAGAAGYLSKKATPDDLITAIEQIVIHNKRYISPAVAEQLALYLDTSKSTLLHQKLSDREYEVFCLLAAGKKVTEIAAQLSLSPRTVHTYRSRVLEKMKMESDVHLTHYALENNLVDY